MIGCQPENSPVMYKSVQCGSIVNMESLETLSDGTGGGVDPEAVRCIFLAFFNGLRYHSMHSLFNYPNEILIEPRSFSVALQSPNSNDLGIKWQDSCPLILWSVVRIHSEVDF